MTIDLNTLTPGSSISSSDKARSVVLYPAGPLSDSQANSAPPIVRSLAAVLTEAGKKGLASANLTGTVLRLTLTDATYVDVELSSLSSGTDKYLSSATLQASNNLRLTMSDGTFVDVSLNSLAGGGSVDISGKADTDLQNISDSLNSTEKGVVRTRIGAGTSSFDGSYDNLTDKPTIPTVPGVASTSQNGLMSSTDKSKLDGVETGAEVNVNADWSASSGDAQILNKPTIPAAVTGNPADTSSTTLTKIKIGNVTYAVSSGAGDTNNYQIEPILVAQASDIPAAPSDNDSVLATAAISSLTGTWEDTAGTTVSALAIGDVARYDATNTKWIVMGNIRGSAGANAANVQIQFSTDGSTGWGNYSSVDKYIRFSVDGGTNWTVGMKFVGDDGDPGDNASAVQIEYSDTENGTYSSTYASTNEYIRFSVDGGTTWSSGMKFVGEDGTTDISGKADTDLQNISSSLDSSQQQTVRTRIGAGTSNFDGAYSNLTGAPTIPTIPGVATTSTDGLMSSTDKTKLDGVASGAEVNVQADWNVTDGNSDAYIANKPAIPNLDGALGHSLLGSENITLVTPYVFVASGISVPSTIHDADLLVLSLGTLDDGHSRTNNATYLGKDWNALGDSAVGDDGSTGSYDQSNMLSFEVRDFEDDGAQTSNFIDVFFAKTSSGEILVAGEVASRTPTPLTVVRVIGGGEQNVKSDWDVTDSTLDSFIENKPTIPANSSDLADMPSTASATEAQILDWDATNLTWRLVAKPSGGGGTPADGSITTAKLADDAVTAAKLADDAVVSANITDANVTTAKIADDAITEAKIADDAVPLAGMKAGTAGKLIGYDASGNPAEVDAPSEEAVEIEVTATASNIAAESLVTPAGSYTEASDIQVSVEAGNASNPFRDGPIGIALSAISASASGKVRMIGHATLTLPSATYSVGDDLYIKRTGTGSAAAWVWDRVKPTSGKFKKVGYVGQIVSQSTNEMGVWFDFTGALTSDDEKFVADAVAAEAPLQVQWDAAYDGDPTAATFKYQAATAGDASSRAGDGWDATNIRWQLADNRDKLRFSNEFIAWDNCAVRIDIATNGINSGFGIYVPLGTAQSDLPSAGSQTSGHYAVFDYRGSSGNGWQLWYSAVTAGNVGLPYANCSVFNGAEQREDISNNRGQVKMSPEFDAQDRIIVEFVRSSKQVEVYAGLPNKSIKLQVRWTLPTTFDVSGTTHTVLSQPGPYFGVFGDDSSTRRNYLYSMIVGNTDIMDSRSGSRPTSVPTYPTTDGDYVLQRETPTPVASGNDIGADYKWKSLPGVADAAVTTAKLADNAVTAAKLADAAVDTAAIVDANVTTAKVADDAITTAKIAGGTDGTDDYKVLRFDASANPEWALIEAVNLEATNTPADGQIASYDSASGGLTWENMPSGSGGGSSMTKVGSQNISLTTAWQLVAPDTSITLDPATVSDTDMIFCDVGVPSGTGGSISPITMLCTGKAWKELTDLETTDYFTTGGSAPTNDPNDTGFDQTKIIPFQTQWIGPSPAGAGDPFPHARYAIGRTSAGVVAVGCDNIADDPTPFSLYTISVGVTDELQGTKSAITATNSSGAAAYLVLDSTLNMPGTVNDSDWYSLTGMYGSAGFSIQFNGAMWDSLTDYSGSTGAVSTQPSSFLGENKVRIAPIADGSVYIWANEEIADSASANFSNLHLLRIPNTTSQTA